jgi:hypothetical protein
MRALSFAYMLLITALAVSAARARADEIKFRPVTMHTMHVLAGMPHPGIDGIRIVVTDSMDVSPLGLDVVDGHCVLTVVDAPGTDIFWSKTMGADLDFMLQTSLAHEFGHCPKSPGVTGDPHDEVAADRYALRWTMLNRPQDFEFAVAFLTYLRRHTTQRFNDTHANSLQIQKMANEIREEFLK